MYSLLLAIIYLAFISLGLPDSLLGAGWPVMRLSFDVPLSYAGIISMIISGGTIISSLMSERLTKKVGTKLVTGLSILLTAAALFGFSISKNFPTLYFWAIPYGLGAGAIDAALNNYVAIHYSSRHMSWLHSFWGVGTIISPYIMSMAISKSSWNNGYRIVSFIQLGIAVIVFATFPLWKVNKNHEHSSQSENVLGIKNVLKIKGVPFLLTGFFAYCSAEQTAMLWTSSYLFGVKNVSEELAAAFASLFFVGMTIGRFVSGFISDKLGDRNMIRLGTGIAFCGVLLLILPVSQNIFALTGCVIIGLGCAPIYPCIIHSTPTNFGAENSQAVMGIQMASAYVGSTFMPPVFGLLANHVSLKIMPFYIAFFLILMIFMLEKTFKAVIKK